MRRNKLPCVLFLSSLLWLMEVKSPKDKTKQVIVGLESGFLSQLHFILALSNHLFNANVFHQLRIILS